MRAEDPEKDSVIASPSPTPTAETTDPPKDKEEDGVGNECLSQSLASSVADDEAQEEKEGADEEQPPITRQWTELGPPVKVSRLKRRGLFGQLTLLAEVENPKTYSRKKKWFITFVVAWAGVTAPMGSSIFFRESWY